MSNKWYCGELQFVLEQPTLSVEGVKLSIVDTIRVTITSSGRIVGVEVGDEWGINASTVTKQDQPALWGAVVEFCETAHDEPIVACLMEYQQDRPNRIADSRNRAMREAV